MFPTKVIDATITVPSFLGPGSGQGGGTSHVLFGNFVHQNVETMGRDRCKVSGVSKLLLPCAMGGSVFQKLQSDPQFLFQNANQENCPFPEILQKGTISCLVLTLMI